jgi:hypothetical protein
MSKWIKILDQQPPKAGESPETDGHYWLLVPYSRDPSRSYVMMWAGNPFRRSTHWAKVEPFPELPKEGDLVVYKKEVE